MTTILSASRSARQRVTRGVGLRVNRRIGQLVRGPLSSLSIQIGILSAALTFVGAFVTGLLVMIVSNVQSGAAPVIGPLIAVAVACAAVAGLISYQLAHHLFRPLRQLKEAAARLATGDLSTSLVVDGSQEFRALSRTLDNARHELEGVTNWLTHEKAWAEYLVDSISEGIVTLDAQNRVTFMSRAAAALIGTKRVDAIGKPLSDLLIPAENDGHVTDLLPPPGGERTVPVVRADGRTIALSITGATLTPPVESTARTALVFRDVTSENAMQRLQSYFLANLSHELQTPLASLRTSAELLVTDHDDLSETDHHKLHTGIYRGILRLEALIDNLLASASVQAGRFKVKPTAIDLGEPLDDAMLFMEPLMDAVNIELDTDLPVDLPQVYADSRRITQVLVNLLSNTIKYTPPGSTVQVSAAQTGQLVRVQVADEGPGIPEEAREMIFSRFGRLEHPGARKDHGAGLGLYIARTIVESHGGAIGVEPRPDKGKGTIFWFTLPLAVKETA